MKQEGWAKLGVEAEWAHLLAAARQQRLCPFPPGTAEHGVMMQAMRAAAASGDPRSGPRAALPPLWAPAETHLKNATDCWATLGGAALTGHADCPLVLYEAFAPGSRPALGRKVAARARSYELQACLLVFPRTSDISEVEV